MKISLKYLWTVLVGLGFAHAHTFAQTDGGATFAGTLVDYDGSGTRHWTVAWVTTEAGNFIKTLRKQGPSITATHWNDHCGVWYAAKGGSTALDGYSSATAADYTGTNSPVIWTWNCRDANTNLVADGTYKFWIQYAENSGQGPYTTNGMLWTKGPVPATNTYPNQLIRNMQVVWIPIPPPYITSIRLSGNNLVLGGTGPSGKTYHVRATTNLSQTNIQWIPIKTNTFDSGGNFSFTNAIDANSPQKFYQLKVP